MDGAVVFGAGFDGKVGRGDGAFEVGAFFEGDRIEAGDLADEFAADEGGVAGEWLRELGCAAFSTMRCLQRDLP